MRSKRTRESLAAGVEAFKHASKGAAGNTTHRLLDLAITSRAALLTDAFKDALGRVALLLRKILARFQNLPNPLQMWADLGLRPVGTLEFRRGGLGHNLLVGLEMKPVSR